MFNHLGLYIECKSTVLFEKNRICEHFSKKVNTLRHPEGEILI